MNTRPATRAAAAVLATLVLASTGALAASAAPGPALPRFIQVETGWAFAAALTDSGDVYTWGLGYDGELGLGDDVLETATPLPIDFPGKPSTDPVTSIALGPSHGLALTESGAIWAWGDSGQGKLGIGITDDQFTAVDIEIGDYLTGGEKVISIAAGSGHSLALTDAGRLYGWGDNTWGQANYDSFATTIFTPQEMQPIKDTLDMNGVDGVLVAAAGGSSFVMAESYWGIAWGFNGNGRLGLGWSSSTSEIDAIIFASVAADAGVVDFDAGFAHGIAAFDDGSVWVWGALGDEQDNEPVRVTGLPSGAMPVSVGAGDDVAFVVLDDGRVYAWGTNGPNDEGQLGLGQEFDGDTVDSPTLVSDWPAILGDSTIVGVGAGEWYSAGAISSTGGVYTWGSGATRGDGTWDDALAPVNIRLGALPAGTVALDDDPLVGREATAVADGWPSNAALSAEWKVDGTSVGTGWTYTPDADDTGLPLLVTVTGTAENWDAASADSPAATVGEAPVLDAATLPDGTAGVAYSEQLSATGTTPLDFEVTDGDLPTGLTLDADGLLHGTTTVAGTWTFEVTVTNDAGSDTREYTLVIEPGPVDELDLSVPSTVVPQGGSVTLTVLALDEFGNETDVSADPTVTVTSSVGTDVVSGTTVTFPHASPHVLTVGYGTLTATILIEVTPAATGLGDTGVEIASALGVAALALSIGVVLVLRVRRRGAGPATS